MPTYEYLCDACQHGFERFQSITAKTLRKCPACGRSKLKRLIGSGAGVIFKGSGFYETDYRSESYKKAAKAESDAQTKSSDDKKSSDTKSESKSTSESTTKAESTSKDTDTKKKE